MSPQNWLCSRGCNVMHLGDIIIQEKAVIGQKINKIYELLIKEVCCILVHWKEVANVVFISHQPWE